MNRRDILTGLVILAVLVGLVWWLRRPKTPSLPSTSNFSTVQEKIQNSFRVTIPEDVEKAELTDVSGGTGSGIATRKYEAGRFTHTVLADLPDPAAGTFYEGWLVRGKEGDANFAFFSTGKLRVAKGGYLLEFQSNKDYRDYKGVVVTLEKVFDNKPEKHILEGSF